MLYVQFENLKKQTINIFKKGIYLNNHKQGLRFKGQVELYTFANPNPSRTLSFQN